MRRTLKRMTLTLIALCLAVAAAAPAQDQKLEPKEARRVQLVLLAWFECEECNSGELAAVVRLGRQVVPMLGAAVQRGPSPASLELYRGQLVDAYAELRRYAESHPKEKIELQPAERYVATYLENYVATYKVRAAKALAAIGGDDANAALKRGLEMADRDDVKEVITNALRKQK